MNSFFGCGEPGALVEYQFLSREVAAHNLEADALQEPGIPAVDFDKDRLDRLGFDLEGNSRLDVLRPDLPVVSVGCVQRIPRLEIIDAQIDPRIHAIVLVFAGDRFDNQLAGLGTEDCHACYEEEEDGSHSIIRDRSPLVLQGNRFPPRIAFGGKPDRLSPAGKG
jgi:hypothetical protein